MSFKIETYIYVAERSIETSGEEPLRRALQSKGWTVQSIETTPANGWLGAGGLLAEHHPTTIIMDRPGATKAAAEEAVSDAIRATGNYSVAASIAVAASDIGSGDAFEEDGRYAGALSVAKFVAVAVVAVAAVALVVYAAPLIRTAAAASKGRTA